MSEEIRREPVDWEPIAAGACFAVAVLSLVLGFVFTTQALLDAHAHPRLHGFGLTLLVVGIPIMVLGGHFMDLGDSRKNRRARSFPFDAANEK